jgi:formylglycine-generating enzyme
LRRCPHCTRQLPSGINYCPYCARRLRFAWWIWLDREKGGVFLGLIVTLWLIFGLLDLAASALGIQTERLPITQEVEVARQVTATANRIVPTFTPRPIGTAAPTLNQAYATRMATGDGAEQLLVPAGDFIMGTDHRRWANTQVVGLPREVQLERFWIDRLEVNNEQFAAFLNATGNQLEQGAPWLSVAESRIRQVGDMFRPVEGYGEHPVTFVTWYGAAAYCQWVGRRLPTDAEWEKAARGRFGISYPWGEDEPNCQAGNYIGCVGTTMPGGSYPMDTSPYGAQDMFGNVSEWVDAWEGAAHWNTPTPATAEALPGRMRVVRGSGWSVGAFWGLTYYRGALHPSQSGDSLGLRCAEDRE